MKKRTIIIGMFILFLVGVISIIGTYAIDTTITEGNSSTADYLFNITLGDRTNREVVIPSYDSKIVDIKISNPNEFAMSYLLYIEGVNSNISVINIKDTEASGVLASKTVAIIQVFIQNNSNSDITIKIKDIVGFAKETLTLPSNSTSINKGSYYKAIVKSNNNTYGKVKPNIKLSTLNGILKYEIVPNTGYKYKSTTCNGTIENNTLTISNITSNINCEIVFEPIEVTVSFDTDGGEISTTYTEAQEHTYTVPYSGTYKLEVWGAQGGGNGGYGGYATGNIKLSRNQKIYINVGGQGQRIAGGYNGGGQGQYQAGATTNAAYGGGGATHIASQSGLLKSLSGNISSIYIVSGAGGGGSENSKQGGSGGGYLGNNGSGSCYIGKGGSQTAGGTAGDSDAKSGGFGYGGDAPYGSSTSATYGAGGGGGGFYGGGGNSYGGGSNCAGGGAGGSGYIGNSLLSNKYMYCYNCSASNVESTKTYSTTNVSSSPVSNYAKSGGGAAKITLINANYATSYGQKYGTLLNPTKSGYIFLGWYTKPNGQGTRVTKDTVLTNTSDHTLYANWGAINKYTTSGSYTYTVPCNGFYKLEVWGAQGGGNGGYGGYSKGNVYLTSGAILYINVGGQGERIAGGYNGGGQGQYQAGATTNAAYGGGGATHIASQSGLLKSLSGNISSIYIVSGAGGGGSENSKQGGSGGGYLGNNGSGSCYIGKGGSQTAGGTAGDSDAKSGGFGYGGDAPYGSSTSGTYGAGGGGGGFYGGGGNSYEGGSNCAGGGAGGSGYIGNSQLTGKYMYCYNCTTSDEVNTKTYTTTNVSSSPISNYAKSGDGAAIITFLGEDTGAPVGTLTASKDYNNINVSINATDDMGIDHYEYYLSTSSTCPTEGYTISSSSSHKFDITETGTYYVCARVVDIAHNVLSLVSQPINYSRIYSVKVRYNVNGGTITPNTSTYTWTTDDTGLIYQNGNIYEQVIRHGTPADLADYNNSNFINITGDNLYVTSGNEWICLSGCSTANKIFNQTTKYNTSDFCDVTDDNCTVVLGVNFKRLTIPVFTYTGSYQIVDDNNNVISNTSTWTGNWKIRFLTDGTLTFTELKGAENGIDLFIVGGGGDGAQGSEYILNSRGGGGGGGGAAITVTKFPVEANVSYTIDIGAAKSNTSFKKGSTAYYTALAGSTPDRPSYTESGGWYVPIGAGGAGRLSGQTSKYGAASVIVKAGASGYSSAGNYEFNGSSGKRYGAGGGCGSNGIAQSAGGWADAGAAGGSNGGGQGGAGCSYVNQGSGYETVGGYNGSAATANTGSGGGGGGGHCGYSATSTGGSGYGGSGGTGIIIIRNTR